MPIAIEEVLGRLDSVRRLSDSGWIARCPAHHDQTPSLSIGVGRDDHVLLCCHAGCETSAVVAALGMTMADLRPDTPSACSKDERVIVAAYEYLDEDRVQLFEVVRFKPKDFRQRRRDGSGGYIWNLKGVRPVLYRLPEILTAATTNTSIYVVEGEKDVHSLEQLGVVATCNPGGAGKWRDDYSRQLAGARLVAVLPDNDKAGRDHAAKIAASLAQVGVPHVIVELSGLPEKGDVSDWFAAGHTAEELKTIVARQVDTAAAPESARPPDQGGGGPVDIDLCVAFSDIEAKPVRWVWRSWIPAGMPSILFGLSGLGKSHIYTDIASRISRGASFPDGSPAPLGNVIILSAEDAADSVLKPRLVYAQADCSRIFHFPSVARFDEKGRRVFSLVADLEILKKNITRHHATFAVLDPITAYLSGVESHIVTEVRAALALVDEVAQSTGAAFLCVMHPNKSMSGDMKALQRLSGSGAFGDAPRCVMLVAEDPDRKDEKRRLLLPAKMNLGLWPEGVGYTITADGPLTCSSGVSWDRDPVTVNADEAMAPRRRPSPSLQAAMDFLTAALADGDWHPARDLIDEADQRQINKKTLERAAKRLNVAQRKVGFPAASEWCVEGDF